MSVSRSASGDGRRPLVSSVASTKRSISPRAPLAAFTSGGTSFAGGMNAQWGFHSAPCSIHRTRIAFSRSSRVRRDAGAGIITAGSVLRMRSTSALRPGRPDTIAWWPEGSFPNAISFRSKRSPALRARSSGP